MTIFYSEPDAISYMPLPDGNADVWLRTNITESTDDDGVATWEAEEVYFRTSLTEEEVVVNFDTLFENGGSMAPDDVSEEQERLNALEDAMLEMGALISALYE